MSDKKKSGGKSTSKPTEAKKPSAKGGSKIENSRGGSIIREDTASQKTIKPTNSGGPRERG